MSPTKNKGRRSNGEGCVYWREDRQRWIAEYVVDNFTMKQRRITKSFKTEREATAHLAKLRTQVEQGLGAPDNRMTVSEIVDYWLANVVEPSKLAPNTKSSYHETATLHIKPVLGKRKLINLRYEHVQGFINGKRSEGYSKSAMKTMMTVVRQSLDQAMKMDKLNRNVARTVSIPEPLIATEKVKGWKPDEAKRFLDVAARHHLFTLFVLAAMVGPRRGEVLGLQWSDLNVENKTLLVERQVIRVKGIEKLQITKLKSKKSRRLINLPQRCVDLLQEHREAQDKMRVEAGDRWQETGAIFTTRIGTWIEPRKLNHWMSDICEEAGLETAGLHKLRHTAATVARALGVDWKEIQAMLGHASAQITMDIYVDDIPELQQNAAELIDKGFVIVEKANASQPPSKSPSAKPKREGPAPKGRLPGGRNAI